jgi:hypothetical protein
MLPIVWLVAWLVLAARASTSAACTCACTAHLQAKRRFLLGPGSGLADLRGQHSGATSKFGLRFNN